MYLRLDGQPAPAHDYEFVAAARNAMEELIFGAERR